MRQRTRHKRKESKAAEKFVESSVQKVRNEQSVKMHGDEEAAGVLEEWNLELGQRVRWRRGPTKNWSESHVLGANNDGSINVTRSREGGIACIMPENIEVALRGPRGGTSWIGLEEYVESTS